MPVGKIEVWPVVFDFIGWKTAVIQSIHDLEGLIESLQESLAKSNQSLAKSEQSTLALRTQVRSLRAKNGYLSRIAERGKPRRRKKPSRRSR